MVAMLAVIFLSGWFLLGGIAAAAGLNCSGGNDCSSASDEMAPYLGVLLVAFAATAPTVTSQPPVTQPRRLRRMASHAQPSG